mgnify:CR=1 FL=1
MKREDLLSKNSAPTKVCEVLDIARDATGMGVDLEPDTRG